MSNPGRAARKRAATEVDSATTTTFRPGQVVAVEAAAFGDFDGVTRGTVKKADEFGRVVSRYGSTEGRHKPSLISLQLSVFSRRWIFPMAPRSP